MPRLQVYMVDVDGYEEVGDYHAYSMLVKHRSGISWRVVRRFSAFVALHEAFLDARIQGPEAAVACLLPQAPQKSWLRSFSQVLGREVPPDFLEQRQRGLQVYLEAVLGQPLLARHPAVQVLLGVRMPEPPAGVRVVKRDEDHELEIRPATRDGEAAPVDGYSIEIFSVEIGTSHALTREVGATGTQLQRARIGRLTPGQHRFIVAALNLSGSSEPIDVVIDTAHVHSGKPFSNEAMESTYGRQLHGGSRLEAMERTYGRMPNGDDPRSEAMQRTSGWAPEASPAVPAVPAARPPRREMPHRGDVRPPQAADAGVGCGGACSSTHPGYGGRELWALGRSPASASPPPGGPGAAGAVPLLGVPGAAAPPAGLSSATYHSRAQACGGARPSPPAEFRWPLDPARIGGMHPASGMAAVAPLPPGGYGGPPSTAFPAAARPAAPPGDAPIAAAPACPQRRVFLDAAARGVPVSDAAARPIARRPCPGAHESLSPSALPALRARGAPAVAGPRPRKADASRPSMPAEAAPVPAVMSRGQPSAAHAAAAAAAASTAAHAAAASSVAAAARGGWDDDESLCVVCMSVMKSHAFVPCGHRCVCADCGEDVLRAGGTAASCPVCRGSASSIIQIFT